MYTLGVNTGTSVDAVDLCLVEWDKSNLKNFKIIKEASFDFDPKIKANIEKLINQQKANLEDISDLNFDFSVFLADTINKFKNSKPIDLIGIHGQTVYHGKKSTWQIGDGSVIANITNTTTVSDFRTADMASGGNGAPLISFLDETLIRNEKKSIGTLNIGGIANLTIMQAGKETIAYDTGPGNTLIDVLCNKLYKRDFDEDGEIAARGKIDHEFINSLIESTAYFHKPPPKTTGREYFCEKYAEKFLDLGKKDNIIATASYFTVETITRELKKHDIKKLYVSGGGLKNKFVLGNLQKQNPDIQILSHAELGIDDRYKEALLFSLLAFTSFNKIPNNIPSSTGSEKKSILGKVSYESSN